MSFFFLNKVFKVLLDLIWMKEFNGPFMNLAYSVFSSSTMKHPNPGHSQNLKEVLQSVMEVFNLGSVTTNDIMRVNQHC